MSEHISLDPSSTPSWPRKPAPPAGSEEQPTPKRRSWFRKTWHGIRWLAATPADWVGVGAISRGAALLSSLSLAARVRAKRDQRFRLEDGWAFDLRATALLYGVTPAQLEARLAARQRQTAALAYVLFGFGCLLLLAWLRTALSMPLTGARLVVAIEFLPFCCLFFLLAFYNALINFQIRNRRTAAWREYLTTAEGFLPR